ncbi:cyclin-D1-1 [Lycium ferocissimum]|uniref:cyclin-D1-1 n=1 Tax=Lycium ferocissimum TaxID=112874 RepID=UPI0028151944|nr:cyclin-D1-1 [Lycium ferocissimum]
MSVSCSDCFSGLLCDEDSDTVFSSDIESRYADIDESIAGLIEDERNFVPGFDYIERFQSQSLDVAAREESVAWILKVQRHYGFQPLTAYLAVNYFDRFLYSRSLPQTNGWPLQLLSVACLSLAAKMEEPLVPSLLDLQVEGAKYIFEPKTIQRMEFLVLRILDWRLRSITPFSYLSYFAYKLDSVGTFTAFLISRASQIILSNIQEASFLEYWPSCIAAATILCAANDLPNFSLVNAEHAESWCDGLHKDKIVGCYKLVQKYAIALRPRRFPRVIPQVRVMTRASTTVASSDSSPSSSSSSSSSTSYKRRKLSNSWWSTTDDDRASSE